MSKHYNLTVTDNNGKAVTTTNVSTEHPEELMRMLTLAGKTVEITPMDSSCGCGEGPCGCGDDVEALNAEAEYRATPANDELDLDDFSKKTANSISRQKKSIQPSNGDNPLEYSVNEDERIYSSQFVHFAPVGRWNERSGRSMELSRNRAIRSLAPRLHQVHRSKTGETNG